MYFYLSYLFYFYSYVCSVLTMGSDNSRRDDFEIMLVAWRASLQAP